MNEAELRLGDVPCKRMRVQKVEILAMRREEGRRRWWMGR